MLGSVDLVPLRALLGLSSDFEDRLTRAVADRIAEGCEPPLSRLLTINQVAEILAVSESTIRRLIESGEIVYVRVNGSIRVRPGDVDAYIERQAVE